MAVLLLLRLRQRALYDANNLQPLSDRSTNTVGKCRRTWESTALSVGHYSESMSSGVVTGPPHPTHRDVPAPADQQLPLAPPQHAAGGARVGGGARGPLQLAEAGVGGGVVHPAVS